jgi:hypothetical protein
MSEDKSSNSNRIEYENSRNAEKIWYFILHNNYCKKFIPKNNLNNVPEENKGYIRHD